MSIKADKKLLFKALLPQILRIELNEAEEGGYWAKTLDIPCYSQGETLSELFSVLTKAIYAFYDVPEKLIDELGTYLPVASVQKSVSEQKPKTYTLEDILPHPEKIRELQRV